MWGRTRLAVSIAVIVSWTMNERFGEAQRPRSSSRQAVQLQVTIIRLQHGLAIEQLMRLSGPTVEVDALIEQQVAQGQIVLVDRIQLTTLENEKTLVHSGKTVPIVSGRSFAGRGGGGQTSYRQESIGTLVSATASVDGNTVVVNLSVEKSQLAQRTGETDSSIELVPLGIDTLKTEVTTRISDGETVLAGGLASQEPAASSGQLILASVRLVGDLPQAETATHSDEGDASQLRIISLQRTTAKDAASLVQGLIGKDAPRIQTTVDPRTNSLILSSDDPSQLDVVEAVLRRLEESETWSLTTQPATQDSSAVVPEATEYDAMTKEELEQELRRLQAELIHATRDAYQASDKAKAAAEAYGSAADEEKADALLRMIEVQATGHKFLEQYRGLQSAFDAAKQAYLRRIIGD